MTTADAVARHFIFLAAQMEEPSPLTHMQVQKLVYYAQGWSLAVNRTKLFDAPTEAWQHGPVVPELYHRFKVHDNSPIPVHEGRQDLSLSVAERAVVDWVWKRYRRFSSSGLRDMTRRETPWRSARAGLSSDEPSRRSICPEIMLEYFDAQLTRERRFNVAQGEFDAAIADVTAGRTFPFVG